MDVTEQAGVPVPLFIMTSETNDAETRAFLAEKQYFGYPESSVHFFVQEMAPVVDKDGKILLETKSRKGWRAVSGRWKAVNRRIF